MNLVGRVFGVGFLAFALMSVSGPRMMAQAGSADAQIQTDVAKALNNKRFSGVKTNVQDGVVTLSGTVSTYADKADADNKAHHRKNVKAVQNMIQVQGPVVEDAELRAKLSQKVAMDRVGYGTTAFNAITVQVHNGVVTLGGMAYGPTDKASAISLVSNYPGVKDVIDNIDVAPTSPMDDRIRIATARAVYGAPQLNRYALDPVKPIRIIVVNGNVTLAGMVDSQSDKEVANLRANSVPGVFKVTNDLQVANQGKEK